MIFLAILIAVVSMAFTMFCGIKYVHPGSHRGYADDLNSVTWNETVKHKWWDFKDIPVPVSDSLSTIIRAWWWLATGTNLKKWAAIHRHNSIHETKIWPEGKTDNGRLKRAAMYSSFANNKKLVELYSIEVPESWIDTNLYYRFPLLGPIILFVILYCLLGYLAFIPWLAQMAWTPFWRSESVNGWDPKEHEWNRLFLKIKEMEFCK
jgi:hypothetical protein